MKRMAWHWTFGVSAVALAFAACTVTSTDGDDDAGTGGSTGGSGGETGGSGGTAGTTGGSAGAVTGGSAGAATGGSAGEGGSGGIACADGFGTPAPTDDCSVCLIEKCCTEIEACVNEPSPFECATSFKCFAETCTDAATYQECKSTCDDGNFNANYSTIVECLETNCIDVCG